jgi:hypothetical protein
LPGFHKDEVVVLAVEHLAGGQKLRRARMFSIELDELTVGAVFYLLVVK